MSLLDKSTAELLATKDSMIALAAALDPLQEANREKDEGARGRALPPRAALRARRSSRRTAGSSSPDANSHAPRHVRPHPRRAGPGRAHLLPADDARGRRREGDGRGRVQRPEERARRDRGAEGREEDALRRPEARHVPVNFLSTVDTTGGNSGSATLNAKGELCGLLFDGTFDTVASDYLFDTEKTRSIHVDSRYMLWTMSEVDGATNLLKEIGEAPSLDVTAPAAERRAPGGSAVARRRAPGARQVRRAGGSTSRRSSRPDEIPRVPNRTCRDRGEPRSRVSRARLPSPARTIRVAPDARRASVVRGRDSGDTARATACRAARRCSGRRLHGELVRPEPSSTRLMLASLGCRMRRRP